MRTRTPYTECRLYVDGIPSLRVGDYITTPAGSAYLVTELKPSRSRPLRRNLRCLRWPIGEIPADARTHEIRWYRRDRTRNRRPLS